MCGLVPPMLPRHASLPPDSPDPANQDHATHGIEGLSALGGLEEINLNASTAEAIPRRSGLCHGPIATSMPPDAIEGVDIPMFVVVPNENSPASNWNGRTVRIWPAEKLNWATVWGGIKEGPLPATDGEQRLYDDRVFKLRAWIKAYPNPNPNPSLDRNPHGKS